MDGLNRRVLIVEDEAPQLQVLVQKLTTEGFDVLDAKDGEEGLKIALAEHPDLIFVDLLMPKMDGLTMVEKLRLDSWGKHVPIIILTNLNMDDKVLSRVVRSQPAYYFIKADMEMDDVAKKAAEVLS